MPFDPVSLSPASNAEAAALAFAASLDVLAGQDNPDAVEDALADVGELLGGLSIHGFQGDLRAHLARVEADLLEDASPRDYSPGLGPNDPDAVFSSHLSDAIDTARADDAADWEQSARALLTRVLVMLSEQAA
jgi:hypothetical protein